MWSESICGSVIQYMIALGQIKIVCSVVFTTNSFFSAHAK